LQFADVDQAKIVSLDLVELPPGGARYQKKRKNQKQAQGLP